jgi:hypothetical protein
MKRMLLLLIVPLVLFATTAAKHPSDGPKIVNAHAFGSTPNVTIRGVVAGGAPWVVKNGKIQLDPDGHLTVRIKGLLITGGALANGNPVPDNLIGTVATVTTVHAALTCGGPGGGTPFTITPTDGVTIGANGDFEIDAQITLPEVCDRPIVLIRIGSPTAAGPWIAASELEGN